MINATPSGMYPNNYDELLINLDMFSVLEAVVDLVYNPLETLLISKAKSLNIIAVNGLMMLVSQAVKSCELFHNQKYNRAITVDIYKELGLSARKGTNIKKELLEQRKIKIIEEKNKKGWKKIIRLA